MDKPIKTIDDEIVRILDIMENVHPYDEKHEQMAKSLKLLCEARAKPMANRISADTLLTVAANLIGIVMIVRHEHLNIVTSKAMSLIIKPK